MLFRQNYDTNGSLHKTIKDLFKIKRAGWCNLGDKISFVPAPVPAAVLR